MGDRLDIAIKNKFSYSREYSKEIILKGYVYVDGKNIKKPSFEVTEKANIHIDEKAFPKYVSRAGLKLEKSLIEFSIDVSAKTCLDIGASTGGFSDCMLQFGAEKIYAVDTGTSQLHNSIFENDKVISFENTDIRNFDVPEKMDIITIDVSFISVAKILYKIPLFIKENSDIIILIKPQFEAGRENISKNGIVRDKKVHVKIIKNLQTELCKIDLSLYNLSFSPIKGSKEILNILPIS